MKMRIFCLEYTPSGNHSQVVWIEMLSCFCKDMHLLVPVRREREWKSIPEDDLKITSGRF